MAMITVKNLVLSKTQGDKANGKHVNILKGINTSFESGKINAIMAPNGSGKTTFLNILFGNIDSTTKTSGTILLNDKERVYEKWHNEVSFVEQQGYAIQDQTISSMIKFAIAMKKKELKTFTINDEKLDEIYDALNLAPILDKNVNCVSGGERKRAMIAIEMVLMKKILILDEPTSDLDSHLALKLVMYLKKIAVENDIMVILTIHQPSDQVFKRFDNILFLLEGRAIYSGEINLLENFFISQKIEKPENWTISDFVFETFYNKGDFAEFVDSTNNVNLMLSKSVEESNLIMKSATMKNTGEKQLLKWNCNLGHVFLLVKRFYGIRLRTRGLYFSFAVILFIITGIMYLVHNFFGTVLLAAFFERLGINNKSLQQFPDHKTIRDVLYSKIKTASDLSPEVSLNYEVLKEYTSSFVGAELLASLYIMCSYMLAANTSILLMKDQLQNEIFKGLYTSNTLLVASYFCDLVFYSAVFFSFAMLSLAFGVGSLFDIMDYVLVYGFIVCLSLTSNLLNIILITPVGSILIMTCLTQLFKTVGANTQLYISLCAFVASFYEKLSIGFRYILALVILILFPTHPITFLGLYRKQGFMINQLNKNSTFYKSNAEQFNQAHKIALDELYGQFYNIFLENLEGYKWAILLFILSTSIIICLTTVVFSKMFTPRISLKI